MYASNEDEDWVYLHPTPPLNTVFQGLVNSSARERSNSSSSSIISCSSKSNRSASLSSISSIELEQAQNDHETINTNVLPPHANDSIDRHADEQETHRLETANVEDLLTSTDNDLSSSQQPILTSIVDDNEVLPTEIMISSNQDNSSTEILSAVDEHDFLDSSFQINETLSLTTSSESLSLPDGLRHRRHTGVNVQGTDLYNSEILHRTVIKEDNRSQKRIEHCQRKHEVMMWCIITILLLSLPFIFAQISKQWDQSASSQPAKEFENTNQHLNDVQNVPIGNIEGKLTEQLEEKFQNMVDHQLAWRDHEKSSFLVQIGELRQVLNQTKQNLTDTIFRLTNENKRLQEQIKALARRLEVTNKTESKIYREDINCTNSSFSSMDKMVSNIFEQTVAVVANTSINLSGLFEQLSASVSNLVDHRHEYVNKSRRKLSDFASSSRADNFQRSFRRRVENLSSSLRKARLTYMTWMKSRSQQLQISKRLSWRWTIQRDQVRERTQYGTMNKDDICHSKFDFSMEKIRSMKNWMIKVFQP